MNRLIQIDDLWLAASDRIVLFVWDRLSFSRMNLARAFLIAQCVVLAAQDEWVAIPIIGLALAAEEFANRRPAKLRNTLSQMTRTLWFCRGIRVVVVFMLIAFACYAAINRDLGDTISSLLYLAFQVVCWALTPEDPPNPPRRYAFSLAGSR